MDFIGFEEEFKDQSRKPRKTGRTPINRQTKVNIVFDPECRRKFLTGFRKRKQERREKYQEKLDRDLIEEKQRAKEEARQTIKKQSSSHSILPEVEHLLGSEDDDDDEEEEPEDVKTFDIGSTTVSIASLDDTVIPKLIKIKQDDDEDEEETKDSSLSLGFIKYKDKVRSKKSVPPPTTAQLKKSLLLKAASVGVNPKEESLVKKETNRILQSSDAYKKSLKMKQQKSRKFKLNKYQPGARAEMKKKKTNKKSSAADQTSISGGGASKKAKKSKSKNKD